MTINNWEAPSKRKQKQRNARCGLSGDRTSLAGNSLSTCIWEFSPTLFDLSGSTVAEKQQLVRTKTRAAPAHQKPVWTCMGPRRSGKLRPDRCLYVMVPSCLKESTSAVVTWIYFERTTICLQRSVGKNSPDQFFGLSSPFLLGDPGVNFAVE